MIRIVVSLSSILWLASAALAAAGGDIHEARLKNGLHVVTVEDHSCPVVAVQVWYHVGSKDERPDRNGFAHMFEHMMFRGTDRLGPEEHFEYVRKVGGDCNAYTAFDQTVYVQKVPKNQLPMVLWLEAERMASLNVDEAGFATERDVVAEEWRQGINQPYGALLPEVLSAVFKVHPYRWSPIGDMDQLRRATAEELLRFWETYYVPNNATLVVVGDVDHEWVEDEAKRAFGWIPRCAEPPRVTVEEPLRDEPLDLRLTESRGPVPVAAVAYRTVPQDHDDALALEMLMAALGGGESSRLYRTLVDEEEKAVIALAGAMAMEQVGVAAAGAATVPFGDLDGLIEALDRELERVKEEPVTDAELSRVKASFRRALVDQTMTVEARANQVGTAMVFHDGASYLRQRAERIDAMTAADLQRVAKDYFIPQRRITVQVKPTLGGMLKTLLGGLRGAKGTADAETPKDIARAPSEATAGGATNGPSRRGPKAAATRPDGYPQSPPVAALLDARVPMDHEARTLDNGLRVVVVENHEVPLVGMALGLENGSWFDPLEKDGCASLAAAMITKGTSRHDAQALAEELESRAIELSASISVDGGVVSGSAVTGEVGRLARLLADVVREPTFPEAEFRKVKRQALTALALSEKSPKEIARRAFRRGIYGDVGYARDSSGSTESVRGLTPDDCATWWRRHVRPDQAVLYVSGDVEAEVAFELADGLLGDWVVAGEPVRARAPLWPKPSETRILLVDVPGSVQSEIRAGQLGITRGDERYFGGAVLSQIFGGAFNSRLNRSIRVEKGLTYGARGGLRSNVRAGEFEVSTFTKTATTAETVVAVLEEIDRLREVAPTDEELAQAKSYMIGSFAGDHETPSAIVSELWRLHQNGEDASAVERYLDAVGRVEAEQVRGIARSLIDPERLLIVVVGDAAAVESDLSQIAPVTVVDELGEPKVLAPSARQSGAEGDSDDG